MSFHGDVGGIGLAELLQGLAGGSKSGRLTLTGKDGERLVLSLLQGRLLLAAPEGENRERWREAAEEAWADDGDGQVAGLKMDTVARGRRLELCYALLDGGEVRFSFDPTEDTTGPKHPLDIEHLLLEYARIQDECDQEDAYETLSAATIGYRTENPTPEGVHALPTGFLAAVSGQRTAQEIADLLGWPLRRARACLARGLRLGVLGTRRADDYLPLALACLDAGQASRTSARLQTWARRGAPGPMPAAAVQRLAGGLLGVIRPMPASERRTILRRLHATNGDPILAEQHWTAIADMGKGDSIALLHSVHPRRKPAHGMQRATLCIETTAPVSQWLALARRFQTQGTPQRALPLLLLAARQVDSASEETLDSRLELGMGLAMAGRANDATPWILGVARKLIEDGRAGEAIGPLRLLLDHDGRNREARQSLAQARRAAGIRGMDLHPLLTGPSLMVLVAVALILAGTAVVRVQDSRDRAVLLQEVRSLSSSPILALAHLDQAFPEDEGPDVQSLRTELREEELRFDTERRGAWLEAYESVQREATLGDPADALLQILELTDPPNVRRVSRTFPDVTDLRQALVQRLVSNLSQRGPVEPDDDEQGADEERVGRQLQAIQGHLEAAGLSTSERQTWVADLAEPTDLLASRVQEREVLTREKRRVENLTRQETWMRQADALAEKGQFHQALELYADIVRVDAGGDLESALSERLAELTLKRDRLDEARELSLQGNHEQALERLGEVVDDLRLFDLPWAVRTLPVEASVSRSGEPLELRPLRLESAVDQTVELEISHPGYLPRTVRVDRPADQLVILSRVPSHAWQSGARVDALPVEIRSDRVVTDRDGHIARLDVQGDVIWERNLETLSGIARAPVLLPRRPGHLLLVSEGGRVWILDAEDGTTTGPLDLGSAPVSGPAPNPDCISVRLADGRGLGWTHELEPKVLSNVDAQDLNHDAQRFGGERGLQVYRRRENPERTEFPDAEGERTVVLKDGAYYLQWSEAPGQAADTVLLEGTWEYIAWEQSSLDAPRGRVWISDGAGLRSFVPQ